MIAARKMIAIIGVIALAPVAATSVMPVRLADLFREADVVAHVYISSGQTECHDVAVFKAEVLTPFKNVKSGEIIYFGPYSTYEVGSEYIVFLRDSGSPLVEHQKADAREPCPQYPPHAQYWTIMYEGYGVLPIEYTIEIPDGDYGVEVSNSQVILPDTLDSYPRTWKYASARDERWVRKADMLKHLAGLASESANDGG